MNFPLFCRHASVCLVAAVAAAMLLVAPAASQLQAATGQFELVVVDKDTGKPIPCRMHLQGPNNNKRPRKPDRVPFWYDHFALPGKILFKLPTGNYTFTIERGLEYVELYGHFAIENFADDSKRVELERRVNMAAEGWWSGDLDVRRPAADIQLLMEADDLHVAELLTWRNNTNSWRDKLPPKATIRFDGDRFCHLLGGSLVRPGTELFLLGLASMPKLPGADADYPPTPTLLKNAKKAGDLWIDAKPFWWDLPMLVAAGQIDSIQVAHGHLCRDTTINNEADGRPRDKKLYSSYKGNAEWSQEIYFRLLNCGLRIPPSAGSGSGASPNPVGYNRVYVHADAPLSYEKWWQSLRAGQVFITNGPLMKPSVNGELPGHVFHGEKGEKLSFEVGLTISTREPITYLEIIKDGRVDQEIRFDEYAKKRKLPPVDFDRSGWFLVRAVTGAKKTYRFAMTGPYYVEIGYENRISRSSAQFFLDWVYERARQIKLTDPAEQRETLKWHRQARDFWKDLLTKANAE